MNQYHPLAKPALRRRVRWALARFSVGPLLLGSAAGQVLAQSPAPVLAATAPEVVVTGNPLGSGLFELVTPATSLAGTALDLRRASTLGETLSNELGVSSTYYGPSSSRPVIRGLDGDRIRLLQNGNPIVDASSLSFDHAVATDPLVAERIEIVRGPAALLYGGNAIGGVVNTIDNRIPTEAINRGQGRAEGRMGSADQERSGAAVVETGNGQVAVHADAYWRDHNDVRIPGYTRSARLRARDDPNDPQPRNRLPNSFSRGEGGALGAAMTWDKGYAGLSVSSLSSTYGTPAEEDVKIDMKKDMVSFASELRQMSPLIESLKFRLSNSRYEHQEKDRISNVVNTTFRHSGYEGRAELRHTQVAGFRGVLGLQFNALDFAALGDEAFVPSSRSNSHAVFLFEEIRADHWRVSFGLRSDNNRVRSRGDDPSTNSGRFGEARTRQFSARSAAFGAQYFLSPAWSVAGNYAYTERAPTSYELFANGPHAATGTYEIGNPDLAKERSNAIDLALRHVSGPNRWSVGVFQKRFSNFLLLAPTGRNRAADASVEDLATPGVSNSGEPADLPEFEYRQVPALFRGVEAGGRWRAWSSGGTLDLDAKVDTVRAVQSDTRESLPRIPPVRMTLGALYQSGGWYVRGELQRSQGQSRTADNELPTSGYTLANAFIGYRLLPQGTQWEVFLRANNLFDVEARNHVSLLKDIAPLPGRNVVLGVRASF